MNILLPRSSRFRQRGALTLAVSLAILVLSTLVTFNVSKAILMEQKIANNDSRARQAFEAAEAGALAALDYISTDPDRDGNGVLDPNVFDLVADADNLGDSSTTTVGTATVVVMVTDLSGGDMTTIRVQSQGFSDDRSATRTVTQTIVTINPLPNVPANPVVTKGGVVIGGSATVHNPEGHSTIWSGQSIDLGSNNSTSTEVPDVGDPGYPNCMDIPMTCVLAEASNRTTPSVDIIENDASLNGLSEDDFFQNFFGMTPTAYRAAMVTIDTTPANANTDAHLATHEVVWIDGNMSFTGITTGCETAVTGANTCPAANTKPSIVIVDGDASFSGTPHFYGLLFVTGDLNMSGNTTVHGAVVAAGSATSSAGGSLDIWFNSSILAGTAMAGSTTSSSGTWKDF